MALQEQRDRSRSYLTSLQAYYAEERRGSFHIQECLPQSPGFRTYEPLRQRVAHLVVVGYSRGKDWYVRRWSE